MKRKAQILWGLIHGSGHINYGHMSYTRRGVIDQIIAMHRGFSHHKFNGTGLTDAQFWRQIKSRRGYTVRRVSMRVVR